MTDNPTPFPYDHAPLDPYQQGAAVYGKAPTLLKVAGILTLITAGLELLYGLIYLVAAILFATHVFTEAMLKEQFAAATGGGAGAPLPPMPVVITTASLIALFSLMAVATKTIGAIKMLRRTRGAWGWGLAAGIVGCIQLWCIYFCVFPMAVGIFTIIVMSLENTRRYLAAARPTT